MPRQVYVVLVKENAESHVYGVYTEEKDALAIKDHLRNKEVFVSIAMEPSTLDFDIDLCEEDLDG